jgi:hypothetical protein
LIRISALLAVICPAFVMGPVFVPTVARAVFKVATPTCDILTSVKVDGTPARHHYSFQIACDDGSVGGVEAAYDLGSGSAVEKIVGLSRVWSFTSQWICPTDPWIATGFVTCSNGKISQKSSPYYYASISPSDYTVHHPVSADVSAKSRHVLAAQLANALNSASQPKSGPAQGTIKLLPSPLAKGADHSKVLKQVFADLTIIRIDGPTTLPAGQSGTYTFIIGNVGNTAASVEVNILFVGALGQTGQVVADSGLSCASSPGSGKVNTNLHCSGGQVDPQRSATVTVHAVGQTPGNGSVIASVNNSRSLQESDYGNNLGKRDVTVH